MAKNNRKNRNKGGGNKGGGNRGGGNKGGGNKGGGNRPAAKAKAQAVVQKKNNGSGNQMQNQMQNQSSGNGSNKNKMGIRDMRQEIKARKEEGLGARGLKRKLNARIQENRAAGRASHRSQEIENVTDFDFAKRGKKTVEKGEMKYLRRQGYSREDIIDHMEDSGLRLRKGAQRKLDTWKERLKGSTNPDPVEETNPVVPVVPVVPEVPEETTTVIPVTGTVGNSQEQTVTQDNDQTSTIVGDNNTVEQNQDNSINQTGSTGAQTLLDSRLDEIISGDGTGVDITNTQTQEVTQDNDQTSTITGDNNTVWQNQDNSIRQYGGDNRSFVYNGSGSGNDTPVSTATMAGFYDVDDSPAAQAKFNDLHTTLNSDNQKRFAGMGMKTAGMFTGFDARSFDPAELQTRVDASTERSFDRATVKDNDIFGDRDAFRGKLPDFEFGKPPKKVEYDGND
jgi:hypothetical protein